MGDHVIYESRLELGRLLFADFDPAVQYVVAQPFLLKADIDGKDRRHIPDYLLLTDDGPVVDVKPTNSMPKTPLGGSPSRVVKPRMWAIPVSHHGSPAFELIRGNGELVSARVQEFGVIAPMRLGLRRDADGLPLGQRGPSATRRAAFPVRPWPAAADPLRGQGRGTGGDDAHSAPVGMCLP
ncbi:transposase [Streptomyces sp. DG1A-41]|uniref:transposase n=1 Tax=Streptomyces sp. DG1A-41 TaxID=3125779 RepID=UPI0030CF040D